MIKSAEPCKTAKGVPYTKVETFEGKKGTCWDVGYNAILAQNIGNELMIDIEENDKGYMTVKKLALVPEGFDHAQEVVKSVPSNPTIGLTERDKIIVAQVILKEANNFAINKDTQTQENYEMELANGVNALTGTYKLALHNLQV